MRRYVYLLLIYSIPLFAEGKDDILHERIYLQTDKQLYLAGELLWMKLITVDTNKNPLSFSKVAYVELLDESKSLAQVKIELSDGVGDGWMELPPNIPTGYYRLIAYTRFMRNESAEVFFEKNIGIVNLFQSTVNTGEAKSDHAPSVEVGQGNTFSLSTDKTTYVTRDQGNLHINDLPENIWTLSVSITERESIPIYGTNYIQSWGNQSLESSDGKFSNVFSPEYEGHIITGKITDTQNKEDVPVGSLTPFLAFLGEGVRMFAGWVDSKAQVSFYTTYTSGVNEVVTAVSDLSGGKYRVNIESPFIQNHVTKQLPVLQLDSIYVDQLLKRNVALQILYSFTGDSLNVQSNLDSYYKGKAVVSYALDDYTRFPTMGEVITEFVSGIRFRRNRTLEMAVDRGSYRDFGTPLVLLDGIPILNHQLIYNYNPLLVQRIDLYPQVCVFGGVAFYGIVSFSTYRNNYPSLDLDSSTQIIDYEGTQTHRRFYVPDYSNEEKKHDQIPDYRHTLLWDPDVQTQGKPSIQIPFNTSSFTGEFQVTIEGLTKDGKIIRATSSFNVEKGKNVNKNHESD